MIVVDDLLVRLASVRRNGTGWIAKCPAHDDHSPSLSIRDTPQRILLHCFAGCAPEAISHAIGFSMSELFSTVYPLRRKPSQKSRPRRESIAHALSLQIEIERTAESEICGDQLPIRTRHRRAAWKSICKRFYLPSVTLESQWWEGVPHDVDPLWELLAERALQTLIWDARHFTPSLDDTHLALALAAKWLKNSISLTPLTQLEAP